VPYDLSHVMFVCTANVLDTIPGPLRDRMEVIQLPGYTAQEKLQIARRYLVPRQLKATGLAAEQCQVTDDALGAIIDDYTREAGVRNLEREIGSVFRNAAVRIAEGSVDRLVIDAPELHGILGAKKFDSEVAMRGDIPGVATGLAWTPVGGDILFIEAARTPGSGRLILTGQLGDVMKESAQAALSLVKGRAATLGIATDALEKSDIHVHVPAGATPKDGPSAGVAMFVALTSLLSGRPVRSDVAMTGEISLRGLVLPIGGVKEKVLAALAGRHHHRDAAGAQRARPRGHPRRRAGAGDIRLAAAGRRRPGRGPGAGRRARAVRSRPEPRLEKPALATLGPSVTQVRSATTGPAASPRPEPRRGA
jgi:ATP-dependent Lon protease